jgi:hypothetical protein
MKTDMLNNSKMSLTYHGLDRDNGHAKSLKYDFD